MGLYDHTELVSKVVNLHCGVQFNITYCITVLEGGSEIVQYLKVTVLF